MPFQGQTRLALEGHVGGVSALAFSRDGRLLATAGQQGSILVWDMTGQHCLRVDDATKWDHELLSSRSAPEAFAAMGRLARSPGRAVSLLRPHLRPAKAPPSREKIKQLVTLLTEDDFALRRAAEDTLWSLGQRALPDLKVAAADSADLEMRLRAKRLVGRINSGPSPQQFLWPRALEVLERLDTPPARKLIAELSRGHPEAPLTQQAKAALKRLQRKP
jgi:hypothetical protein